MVSENLVDMFLNKERVLASSLIRSILSRQLHPVWRAFGPLSIGITILQNIADVWNRRNDHFYIDYGHNICLETSSSPLTRC